jgi:hypothetical protein
LDKNIGQILYGYILMGGDYMKLDGVNFEYFIDYINNRIHIIDLDQYGTTVANSISPSWQRKLIEQELLLEDIMEFEWICYGRDGYIAKYRDYNFSYVAPNSILVHQPYLKKMEDRRKRR